MSMKILKDALDLLKMSQKEQEKYLYDVLVKQFGEESKEVYIFTNMGNELTDLRGDKLFCQMSHPQKLGRCTNKHWDEAMEQAYYEDVHDSINDN